MLNLLGGCCYALIMAVLLRIGDPLTVLRLGLYFAVSMQLTVGTLIAVLMTAFGRRR